MPALSGLRVLELGQGTAVAFAGKTFADFGADVIKVEHPAGDPARREGPFRDDQPDPEASAPFLFFNRNKRGVTLDPASAAGRDLLAGLAATADLVLAALSLRALAAAGLSLDHLAARQPALVLASLTAFGEDGPYRDYQVTGLVIDAMAGAVNLTGALSRAPLSKPLNLVGAQIGGSLAAAALAAVIASERSGAGQEVQVSAADVLLSSFDRRAPALLIYQVTGETVPRPFGGDRPPILPMGRHQCRDGLVEIATIPRWLPRMLATLQDPGLDAWFAARPDAWRDPETAAVVLPVLRQWLATRTRAECFAQATLAHAWPVYPVSQPGDLLDDPHFAERGTFTEFDHPVAGRLPQPGPPWRMADGGFEARCGAPMLGQHNREIYGTELGMGTAALARARALGIV
ncbi:MAG TPA: CoA transferase [Streptosporangiaceae bacterium]|jgi:crotonobetainyl-CoA:carnitine CoA-transferase CaiB-like acyl-CoA transferase